MAARRHHPVKHSRTLFFARAVALLLPLPLLLVPISRAQSTKDEPKPATPPGSAELRVELTGGDTKVPIADASVYLKFTEDKLLGNKKIGLNLKTNQNGVARSPKIPQGPCSDSNRRAGLENIRPILRCRSRRADHPDKSRTPVQLLAPTVVCFPAALLQLMPHPSAKSINFHEHARLRRFRTSFPEAFQQLC